MKVLKITMISLVTLSAVSAHAAPFQYYGDKFEVVRMGRTVKVVPAQASSRLQLAGGAADCEKIEELVARKAEAIELCKDNSDSAFCRLAANGIRLAAEGRINEDGPMSPAFTQQWQLVHETGMPSDGEGLREAVARAQHVPPSSVQLVPFSPKAAGKPTLQLKPGSLLGKVETMVRFQEENLGRLARESVFVTRNRILACDLAAGRASFALKNDLRLDHLEVTPDVVVDGAFAVHQYLEKNLEASAQGLKPFARAAVTGYLIAKGMDAGRVNEEADQLLKPAHLYVRLFENPNEQPKLRKAASAQDLRQSVYRDEQFSSNVQQDWRIK